MLIPTKLQRQQISDLIDQFVQTDFTAFDSSISIEDNSESLEQIFKQLDSRLLNLFSKADF